MSGVTQFDIKEIVSSLKICVFSECAKLSQNSGSSIMLCLFSLF